MARQFVALAMMGLGCVSVTPFADAPKYVCGDEATWLPPCGDLDLRYPGLMRSAKADFARKLDVKTGDAAFDACMARGESYVALIGFDRAGLFVEVQSTSRCVPEGDALSGAEARYYFDPRTLKFVGYERM